VGSERRRSPECAATGEMRRFRPFECHTGERVWNRQQAAPNTERVAERHPDDVATPRAAVPRLIVASLLFAIMIIRSSMIIFGMVVGMSITPSCLINYTSMGNGLRPIRENVGTGTYNLYGKLREVWALQEALRRAECPERVCAVTRRRFPVGASPTRRFAPAGSNRSRHGGDEMSEAVG
jgi:hypothetical protein